MWYTFITIIHIIVCFFLAIVVLLQQGKGSDVSAVFGGSSQTLFGSSGAGNLLTKLTSASAAIFMITSLTLTYGAAKQNTKSLFDNAPVKTPPAATTEDAPAPQSRTATEPQSSETPAKTENVAQPANVITEEQKARAVNTPQSSSATAEPQDATVSATTTNQAQSATQPTAAASDIKTEEPKAAGVSPSAPTAPAKPEHAATPHHPKPPTPAKKKN